ncbi:MAG: hypothetical protein SWJ54_07840, partial [Cyanobacteriota bacterium]|nr:hypothetical protein [Cyanobacteriota bacterium]
MDNVLVLLLSVNDESLSGLALLYYCLRGAIIAMQNREVSSSQPSRKSTDWWTIAEYLSVVGSTIGSIIAAA